MIRLLQHVMAALCVGVLGLGIIAGAPPAAAQNNAARYPAEGFGDLAERLMPAVVNIATTQRIDGVGQPPRPRSGPGSRTDELFDDRNLNEVS